MEVPSETMVEEREELMVSPTGGNPTLRKAHFLKPSVCTAKVTNPFPLSLPSLNPTFDPQNFPLKVAFNGWRFPACKWPKWVDSLRPRYESVWKKAGICDAILSTTHEIRRDHGLVLGVSERWCPETKSFVFSWGEATITLEDVMVLGGFAVSGQPVFHPLVTTELKEIEKRLVMARKEIVKGKARKGCQKNWLRKFMGSGSDIEHEAFLVLWLSKFIFPKNFGLIRISVYSIAIHLARGTRIALGPAVLAAIYRDLTLLKEMIVNTVKFDHDHEEGGPLELTLWSPFQLVQLWAWERFPALQPNPNSLKEGDTRSARWHKVTKVKVENVRSVLDSASENFLWRPYTTFLESWEFPKFYKEHKGWVESVNPQLDDEFLSFNLCVRMSPLVGLENIEQYLPHRVAMQFGFDQELPCDVPQAEETREIAWSNYCKPINAGLYIPPRLFGSDVTVKYLEWWKQSVSGQQDATEGIGQQPISSKRFKRILEDLEVKRTIGGTILNDRPKVLETPKSCNGQESLGNEATGDNRMVARPVEATGDKESFNRNSVEGSIYKHQKAGLELEDRISKLEEIFAKLKAKKFGSGLK